METILFHHKFAFKCISLNKVKISLASCTISCFAYATLLDTPLTINTITIHNSKNVYNYFICDVIGRGLGVGLASRVREGVRNYFSLLPCVNYSLPLCCRLSVVQLGIHARSVAVFWTSCRLHACILDLFLGILCLQLILWKVKKNGGKSGNEAISKWIQGAWVLIM